MSLGAWLLPKWSWAYPTGAHHELVQAAIGRDDARSLAAARQWLQNHDIDVAKFRDQRLLLAVIGRFGPELRDHAAYARLVGLQRLLWTKSRLAIQEATASLGSLRQAGIELMLIKGAARLALDNAASKRRVAWDIDVVVQPEHMTAAFDILVAQGWLPAPGASPQYLRERLASTRGINLFRGDYGDLDLHSRPFHPGQGGAAEDIQLWQTALMASFAGTTVRVPRAEDRIALALAHGGLDGHTHSDWLVDCATILRSEPCDWDRLFQILLARQLATSAAVTLHYLREGLQFEIPRWLLAELDHAAKLRPLEAWTNLIQTRPKDRSGLVGQVLRAIAKKRRKTAGQRQLPRRPRDNELVVRRLRNAAASATDLVASYRLERSPNLGDKGTLEVDIVLDLPATSVRRRIEMEINSAGAHLCRVRFRPWAKPGEPLRLRLSGTIDNAPPDEPLELVSRPGRQLRRYASTEDRERYDLLPFRVVSCQLR